jgi:hypothetical protein
MRDATEQTWRDPVIEVYKREIDRSLLRENLKRTIEERILRLEQMQRVGRELQRAMREVKKRT